MDYFPSCFKYYFLLIYIETSSEDNPLAIAITRLLALEQAIERRYLKHPLRNEWVNATLFHPVISKTFVTASQIDHYWTGTSLKWKSMQGNIIKKEINVICIDSPHYPVATCCKHCLPYMVTMPQLKATSSPVPRIWKWPNLQLEFRKSMVKMNRI